MHARLTLLLFVLVLVASGCGEAGIQLSSKDDLYGGAKVFNQRCAGCHTLEAAGAEGSSSSIGDPERKDGPNFNQRKEQYEDILYAIQNGGFSSGPMPQNIVTGEQAKQVACFLATYSGKEAVQAPSPGSSTNTSKDPRDCKSKLAR